MKPLKIAFLWHFHQPYYKKDDEFILPWVRLHGVKDYYNFPHLLANYPRIKQTINIVPSLRMQIEDYCQQKTFDKIQILTLKNPQELTENEKREIIRLFFLCNVENMIFPYNRYQELYHKSKTSIDSHLLFSEQDWLDLQVWYNLTWIGHFAREDSFIKRLFNKGNNFTIEEKNILMQTHIEILSSLKSILLKLVELGQLEISCSPMFHPILPLLCNSEVALESQPNLELPNPVFSYPEDAKNQIKSAIEYIKNVYKLEIKGVWPSEGSVSDDTLKLLLDENVQWIATDESILSATLKSEYKPYQKYFPHNFKYNNKSITILFRDHNLSDAIGFVYSRWNYKDAVEDFINKLKNIRNYLINELSEKSLEYAVVPIILDGENCWEFYYQNGIPFRQELLQKISDSPELETIFCSDSIELSKKSPYSLSLEHIFAGSWINANFSIWIGHPEDRFAWSILSKVRQLVEENKDKISAEILEKVMQEIYIAEGSDWFWWYGDEHIAENKPDFDVLFRWHIMKIYEYLNLDPPEYLNHPIAELVKQEQRTFVPKIDGIVSPKEWENAVVLDFKKGTSAMHQVGEIITKIYYFLDEKYLYLRIDLSKTLQNEDVIELQFNTEGNPQITINKNFVYLRKENINKIDNYSCYINKSIEVQVDRILITSENESKIQIAVLSQVEGKKIRYPNEKFIDLI